MVLRDGEEAIDGADPHTCMRGKSVFLSEKVHIVADIIKDWLTMS